jgi:hypothetical protein
MVIKLKVFATGALGKIISFVTTAKPMLSTLLNQLKILAVYPVSDRI